jgi:hypothetical protein
MSLERYGCVNIGHLFGLKELLANGTVVKAVTIVCLFNKSRPVDASVNVCQINHSWVQRDSYSLASLYSVQLLAHLSSRRNADLQVCLGDGLRR